MSVLRSKVLASFKDLHRARLQTFRGDYNKLEQGRVKINGEFRKNKLETDPIVIEKHISDAKEAARILRQHILQFEEIDQNHYRLNITKDTYKLDNIEYQEVSEEILFAASRKGKGKAAKCGEKNKK